MLPKKSLQPTSCSQSKNIPDDYLKLYNKEYHEGHLDWARAETPIFRHYRDNYMKLVQPKSGIRVLELGCSSGKTTVCLAKQGCHVIAVDFDANAIELAIKYADECQVANNVELFCSSADSKEIMSNNFDLVTMLDFVEHVPDEILERIFSNLRDKEYQGDICIYTPDRHHFTEILAKWGLIQGDSTHINLKSRKEWISFLNNSGFKIKKINRETTHWPGLKYFEKLLNHLPIVGGLFTRSIGIRGTIY